MQLLNEQEFSGADSDATIVVTGAATLQAKAADGTWVNVPDGALSDTVVSMRAPGGSCWRFTGVTGTVAVFL